MLSSVPALVSGDLTVRPIRNADWRELDHELAVGRAWLQRWEATQPGVSGQADTRSAVRAMVSWMRRGESITCVMCWRERIIGQVSVSQIAWGSLRSCSIGYWIAERMAGHSLAPTAVALMADHLFQALGMHRIEICMRLENRASRRVAEKLGFHYEGVRRGYIHIDGAWRDHHVFAMLAEDAPAGGVLAALQQRRLQR